MDPLSFQKPKRCPSCGGKKIKQIVYGEIPRTGELMERAKRHEIFLGGNLFWDAMPDWICARCNHRWFDPTDPARLRRAEEWQAAEAARQLAEPVLPLQTIPDDPVPFGFKTAWWAVATVDTDAVVAAFALQDAEPCSWTTGVQRAYRDSVFVTPPIAGWTLVVGAERPIDQDARQRFLAPLLELSSRFVTALLFATHRVVEYHLWAKAVSGRLVRAFACVGESGVTFWNEGSLTPEEQALGFAAFAGNRADCGSDKHVKERYPDETDVMDIAAAWSVSPDGLDKLKIEPKLLGVLGSDSHLLEPSSS
jgi:hypothetical protein